ncbi:putative F-box protein [Forsythia ovata]|uniref:F-box protein n=1 Tax=Forsythia ovata TaxID=205694 RepID=A0ABD1SN50_9LAMI
MTDWSQLPYDLVELIANQLFDVVDFLSFSAVCRYWRLVYLNKNWIPSHHFPWLMLGEYTEGDVSIIQFLSLTRFKVYNLPVPEANGCPCWGTCHGWVVTLSQGFPIRLVNPITRVCFNLPQHSTLRSRGWDCWAEFDWFAVIQNVRVLKFRDEFVTMLMYDQNRSLAFARHGDGAWTSVLSSIPVHVLNVVSFKDKILALTRGGILMLIDIDGPDCPRAVRIASPPKNDGKGLQGIYLVESSENLLLVFRYFYWNVVNFEVYKFDFFEMKWMPLMDLGNNFLLMDTYSCTSVSACGYFKPNFIYFAKHNLVSLMLHRREPGVQNMIVYNIEDQSIASIQINSNPATGYTCPVWTTPALW